jgi:hypothetical protein
MYANNGIEISYDGLTIYIPDGDGTMHVAVRADVMGAFSEVVWIRWAWASGTRRCRPTS